MDSSEVAVRHAVAFGTNLNIRHSLELSDSCLSLARELRYCVIIVVAGWTAVSIVKTIVSSRQPSQTPP